MDIPGTGAHESLNDYRTIKHDNALASPFTNGGVKYLTSEIENQGKVGLCTSISLVQNAEKVYGRKYSPEFLYLLQKKFIDNDWNEGSSIFSALKAGNKYGFLPIEDFVYAGERDRQLPYSEYIKKLQAIPNTEITRLLNLCENKLTGYAKIDVSVPENIAKAIDDSKSGILTRYEIGQEWWTDITGKVSWDSKDINPLRVPKTVISGHAIINSFYDFSSNHNFELTNTWSPVWNNQGKGNAIYEHYKCTEAWIPYYEEKLSLPKLPPHQPLARDVYFGMLNNDDVKRIQHVLGVTETGNFGPLTLMAVMKFQVQNKIFPSVGFVGLKTRTKLNELYFN